MEKQVNKQLERTVLCFGDSLTQAGIWLEKGFAGSGFSYVNAGRGGRRAAQVEAELGEALAGHPEANALLLMLGVNDLPARDPRPGEEKVRGCVEQVEAALEKALQVMAPWNILLVAPPTVDAAGLNEVNREKGYGVVGPLLVDLEAGYRELAKRKGTGFFSLRTVLKPGQYRDGLHPNEEGYAAMGAALRGRLACWGWPSVFVVGDSISMDYHEELERRARGWYGYGRKVGLAEARTNPDAGQGANGGNSDRVLSYVREQLGEGKPAADVLVVNCGLHDIKRDPETGAIQVPLERYRENLETLVQEVESAGKALWWVTTTPVDEERHQRFAKGFVRKEADLAAYNEVAADVMGKKGVPVIDLYGMTESIRASGEDPFRDHVHFEEPVSERQAAFVHEEILRYLKEEYVLPEPLPAGEPVRGWNILSNSPKDGLRVIERARDYGINHLQLSHEITHDLRHAEEARRGPVARKLASAAHRAGIREVVLWDHVFYEESYYPERFRTGEGGKLNLDDAAFWEWMREDYRRMLDAAPDIQGIILTFIETAGRIEDQYSERWVTGAEKLAGVVNELAKVIIGERGLNLYARTFSYDWGEYERITGAVKRFERQDIRLMMKETPHDFFLTHPNDPFAGQLPFPTLIEYDAAGEFNGQGLIANCFAESIRKRWDGFAGRDQLIGYVARTDRYGKTRLIDRPSEVNLYVLKRAEEAAEVPAAAVLREFVAGRYGEGAVEVLAGVFEKSQDIVTSVLYSLGTNVAAHSKLNFDPYISSYARHVSGKWLEPPLVWVGHGVNREFHYWKDIVEHIAPAWAKAGGAHLEEIPGLRESGWLSGEERMDGVWLEYLITEKQYGLELSRAALAEIEGAANLLREEDYFELYHHFKHTELTAEMYRAAAAAYWGFRVWTRGGEWRDEYVERTTREGLMRMLETAELIREYPVKPASGGQWSWVEDAAMAEQYYRWIVEDGWPAEFGGGRATGMGGMRFPL